MYCKLCLVNVNYKPPRKNNLQERNERIFNFHSFYHTELEIIAFAVRNLQFPDLVDVLPNAKID
jgi:hypothetical protein